LSKYKKIVIYTKIKKVVNIIYTKKTWYQLAILDPITAVDKIIYYSTVL